MPDPALGRQIRVYKDGVPGDWQPVTPKTPAAPGGTDSSGQQKTVDEAVDDAAGNTPSRTAQSSDHMNQY